MSRIVTIALIMCCISLAYAQDYSEPDYSGYDYSTETTTEEFDDLLYFVNFYLLSSDYEDEWNYRPNLGLSRGFINYIGDVNKGNRKFSIGSASTMLTLTNKLLDYADLTFFVIYGQLSGISDQTTNNLNFKTRIFDGGVKVSYDFSHFIDLPKITPYVSLGLEAMEYNSKGDLKDEDGNSYYYWTDGSIRNVSENSNNVANSVVIERDNIYESDLRDLDLYGQGKYSQIAFGIPFDVGVSFDLWYRVNFKLGLGMHFLFSDNIDNVNAKKQPENINAYKGNDKFFHTYFGIHYDLYDWKANSPLEKHYEEVDFDEYLYADADMDGYSDWEDRCPNSKEGIAVDTSGCPLDSDGDGVPDYLDTEIASTSMFTDSLGVGITEDEYMDNMGDTIAITTEDLEYYYPDMFGPNTYKTIGSELPEKFKSLDIDNDGLISTKELLIGIDNYFDFNSDLTIDDVYQLNELFFEQ